MSPSLTPAAGPRPSAPGLYLRQIGAVLRLELRKNFFSKRGWWVYLLALGPLAIPTLHWLVESARHSTGRHSIGEDTLVFAGLFHFYRSEEHTSELQSHSFISYAVFCLK